MDQGYHLSDEEFEIARLQLDTNGDGHVHLPEFTVGCSAHQILHGGETAQGTGGRGEEASGP